MKVNMKEVYNELLDEGAVDLVPCYGNFQPANIECYDGAEAVLEMLAEEAGVSTTQLKKYGNFNCVMYGYVHDTGFDVWVEPGKANWAEFVTQYASYIKAAKERWEYEAQCMSTDEE